MTFWRKPYIVISATKACARRPDRSDLSDWSIPKTYDNET
jgi:hypothetical protein